MTKNTKNGVSESIYKKTEAEKLGKSISRTLKSNMPQLESSKYIISVDCMGGDNAPSVILQGVYLACQKYNDVNFILCGDKNILTESLSNTKIDLNFKNRYEINHTSQVVTNDMHPSDAIRPKMSNSSMRTCLELVANNQSHGAISAGNTGSYLALARYILKTIDGISRPAIIAKLPTAKGLRVMLDLGANITCSSNNLVEFAMMGGLFAKYVLKINNPSVGLINVGIESQKGNDSVLMAKEKLQKISQDLKMNFVGFVEGDGIFAGDADVFVVDGFSGNICLKSSEGVAKLILKSLKNELNRSMISKIGALFARKAFKNMKKVFDPRLYNGALWVGLNGIAVKSHGSADEIAFFHALCTTIDMAKSKINTHIKNDMEKIHHMM